MIDGQGGRDARESEPFEEPVQDDPNRAVEDAEPYFPPTDPVTSTGGPPPRSSDGTIGDEALAARIRRELREDSATTHLVLDVEVADKVVTLRGTVDDLTDTDNALEVAGRVPGVEDVIDEMEITEPA